MANLKTGSSGTDVEKLQQALVDAGYDVGSSGVDGIFGANTAAAVKKYQQDNGLAVDGIAGDNTLGSLYGTSSSTSPNTSTTTSATTPATTESPKTATAYATGKGSPIAVDPFTYADYAPSEVVQQANAILQQHKDSQPGAYQSQWQDEIDNYLSQIQNRDPFSYDMNADALYQQYKDNYIQQGKMAKMDTMGQAQAMTGGYGNSYAQSVGQQAYQGHLQQLNNIMPELHQMAFDRYAYEGQQLQDKLGMFMGLESQDYSRHQTDVDRWYTQLQYLTDQYNTERDRDYRQYETGRQEAYSAYATEQDRAWEEYLTDKEKEQSAAEIMASAGNYDRLGEVYGLSEDEIAALKKANTPVATYTGGKGDDDDKVEYVLLDAEQEKRWLRDAEGAKSVEDLDRIWGRMENHNIHPDEIGYILGPYYSKFQESQKNDTGVGLVGGSGSGGGRVGLGTIYATIK